MLKESPAEPKGLAGVVEWPLELSPHLLKRMEDRGRGWEVIVEPDADRRLLVVITAYAIWG